ncbi:hypothetical protein C922_03619 [Plasmodium inui San Antonio 1]|uniref:NTF2 domain-containing protein n=1 Tax=Plasmodium inui San Antonio 1 TaxID=1237626 RepID=W7A2I4_9APIC|nr:hypothetical protein C922_03619 [Plasmodium inui San Antonio 1]EUD65895.1 hypothetical protein C922_03619 [Plasmodium inui San Antonio 1]
MNYRGTDTKQYNKSKNKFPLLFYKNKYSSAKQYLGQGSGPVNTQAAQNTQGGHITQGSHSNQGPHHVGDNVCNVFQGSTTNNPGSLNNNTSMYYKRRSNFTGAGMIPTNSISGGDLKNSSTMMSYNDDIYHFEKQKLLNGGATGTAGGMNAYHMDVTHGNSTSGSVNNAGGNQGSVHPGSSHHSRFYNNKNTYNFHTKKEGRQNYESYLSYMHDGTNSNTHGEVTHGNRSYKNYNYDTNRESYVNMSGPKNLNRYYDAGDGTSSMNMSGQKKVNYFDANVGSGTGGGYNHGATHGTTHGTTHAGVHSTAHNGSRDAGGLDLYGANDQLRRVLPRGKNVLQNPSVLGSEKKEPMLIMINGERTSNVEDVHKVGMKVFKKQNHAQGGDEYEEEEEEDDVDVDEAEEEDDVDLPFGKNSHHVGTTNRSSSHRDGYNNAKEVTFTKNDARKGVTPPSNSANLSNAGRTINANGDAASGRARNPHDGVPNVETTSSRPEVSTPSNHLTGVNSKSLDSTNGSAYNIAYMFIYQYYYVLHTKKSMMHNFYAENAILMVSFNYQNGVERKGSGPSGSGVEKKGGGSGGSLHPQDDAEMFFNLSQINVEGSERSGNMVKMKNKKMIAEYYDKLGISECTVHIDTIQVINLHDEIYLYIHGKIKKNKSTNLFYYFVQNIHLHKYTVCQYYVDVDFVHYYYLDVVEQQLEDLTQVGSGRKAMIGSLGRAANPGSDLFDVKGKEDATKKKAKVSKLNATLGGKVAIREAGEADATSSSRLKGDTNKTVSGLKKGAVKKTEVEPILTSTQSSIPKESKEKMSSIKGQLDEGILYPLGHAKYGTNTKQSVLTSSMINKSSERKNHLAKYAQRYGTPGEEEEDEEAEEEQVDYLDVGDEDDIEEDDEEDADLDVEDDEEEQKRDLAAFGEDPEESYEDVEVAAQAGAEIAKLSRGNERGATKGAAYSKRDEVALLKRSQGIGKPVNKVTGHHDPESNGTNATLKKSNKLKNEDEDVHKGSINASRVGNGAGEGGTQMQAANDSSARKQQIASADGGKKEWTKQKGAITTTAAAAGMSSTGKEAEEKVANAKEGDGKDHVTSKTAETTDANKTKKNRSDGSNNVWKVDSEDKCPKMENILKEEKTLNENSKKKKKEKETSSKVDPNSWVFRVMKNNGGANSGESGTPAGGTQKVQQGEKSAHGAKHSDEVKHGDGSKPTEEGETDVETQEEEAEEQEINANDKKIIIHNIHKSMDKKKINDCIIDRLKNYNDGHAVQIDIYQRSAKKLFPSSFSSANYDKGKAAENYSYAIAELDCRQSQKLLLDLGLYCNGIKLSIENFKEKRKMPEAAKRSNRKFNGFGGGAPLNASKARDDRYRNSFRGSSSTVTTMGVVSFRSKRNNIFVK